LLNPDAVDAKINKELEKGRIAGPFVKPPFPFFKSSPLAIREKSTPGQFRLLHNLSYPYDERSVNFNISFGDSTVKYATISDAIKLVQTVGSKCYMAKSDISDAFRLLPLNPSQYHLMGFMWRGKYYHDKNGVHLQLYGIWGAGLKSGM
jgi:hypothetical protein